MPDVPAADVHAFIDRWKASGASERANFQPVTRRLAEAAPPAPAAPVAPRHGLVLHSHQRRREELERMPLEELRRLYHEMFEDEP